jgi:phospholipase/carboxylesterase
MSGEITRRRFAAITASAFGAFAFTAACRRTEASGEQGRVKLPPVPSGKRKAGSAPKPGAERLSLDVERDATLMIPAGATPPLPLLVLLHGAGGTGGNMLRRLGGEVDAAGLAVLSPDSRDPRSWDGVLGDLGPDVAFINRALQRTFERVDIDPKRISVGGFSDGATYAITLGLINGDIFSRVIAWSPGFFRDNDVHGRPRFFISHGRADDILPIDRCSRVIVPRLQKRGYDVTYREFDGGHAMPLDVVREGLQFAVKP